MLSIEPDAEVTVEPVLLDLRDALPARPPYRDSLRYVVSFLVGLTIHALIFLALTDMSVYVPPLEEAIPVEVIIEPPPPEKPAEPQPEPPAPAPTPAPAPVAEQPPQQDIDLKPATDAPRASDEDQSGEATQPEPAEKPEPEQKLESAEKPEPEEKPAPAEQPQEKDQNEPEKEPAKTPDYSGLQTQLPPVTFSTPAPKSTLMRGQAERSYSATIYAMVMEKLSLPQRRYLGSLHVRVSFGVDSAGHVFQSAVIQSSGDPGIDRAALDAVRKAGTLPPPPNGGPVYLYFDLKAH